MSKPRKVIRSKNMYGKQTHRVRNAVLFAVIVILFVGFGYILGKEWFEHFGPGAEVSSEPDSSLPSSSAPVSSTPEVSSEPEPEPPDPIRGSALSAEEALLTGDALTQVLQARKNAGDTAVVVDLKTEDGVVTFDSQNPLALQWGTISSTPIQLDGLIEAIQEAELLPVARISALKDPTAHVSRQNSFGYNGSTEINWLDNRVDLGGKPWLNPYMDNARSYVAGLCGEAAERGFAAVLLTNVNFPTTPYRENMGLLNETDTAQGILNRLMEEAQAAAGEVPVYNAYDLTWYATEHTQPAGERTAPILDLSSLAANRDVIRQNYGISDTEIAAEQLADSVLREMPAAELALVRSGERSALESILEQHGISGRILLP